MSDQSNLPAKADPKPPIVAGGGMAAIVPQDIEQAFRLSQALARGGDMVPKHFQGQPEQIMAAIMRGMEIGLAPMQALSNIAVINGRASLWGDALPALMQRAGHHLDVELVGEGDDMKAVATLTRGDNGKSVTREFSVADAKKSGLWSKQGPWQSYPKRMLSMRARAWAVRDGAADALMGLQVAEEMQDAPQMRDVTPEPTGFARLASQARQANSTPSPTAEDNSPSAADQDVSTPPQDPTETVREATEDESQDTPKPDSSSVHYANGRSAAEMGFDVAEYPKDLDHQARLDWIAGFESFQEEHA